MGTPALRKPPRRNEGQEEKLQLNPNRNASNKSIPNIKKQKEKKPFDKRKGDWLCPDCHNLNFAFRIICNRCHLSKVNSEKSANEKDYKNNYK